MCAWPYVYVCVYWHMCIDVCVYACTVYVYVYPYIYTLGSTNIYSICLIFLSFFFFLHFVNASICLCYGFDNSLFVAVHLQTALNV